jgi:hypothetical protein
MSTQIKFVACLVALGANGFSQGPALLRGTADWNNLAALAGAAEVRVQFSGSHAVRGRVENVTADSLTMDAGSGQETFMRQQIIRVSVKQKARRGRNTILGLAIGAGLGGALGGATASECSGSICGGYGAAAIASGIGAGAAIAAIIGVLVPAGGWREVYRQ